jgi:hypothetical protein
MKSIKAEFITRKRNKEKQAKPNTENIYKERTFCSALAMQFEIML